MKLDLALIHYPVCNKKKEQIGSAVTNLDLHDIARAGRTYGVNTFYVVTPFADQKKLVNEIMEHWLSGHGSISNPDRKEAFSIIQVVESLEELFGHVSKKTGQRPLTFATCARTQQNTMSFAEASKRLLGQEHMLIMFGTAWGLAHEVFETVDAVLPPVGSGGDYNHLSVRSAVSIVLDRLLGE